MGGCDTESFEDMDEENVKNYLIEQLVPIVAIVDGENYEEIEASLGEYAEYVAGQTLSLSLELRRMSEAPADAAEVEWGGSSVRIKVSRN